MPTEAISSGFEDDSCNDKFGCSDLDETTEATLPKEKGSIVKAVDAEDLQRGDYTIADVILPLPGSRVLYPTHDIAQVYRDLAKKDGISLMESVHSTKEFSITCMTGGYRHVFQKPIDFDWELIQYIDGNVPLVETDLDVIAKTGPVHNIREEGCTDAGGDKICTTGCAKLSVNLKNDTTYTQYDSEAEDEKEVGLHGNCGHGCDAREPQVALKLGFTLPASCYATMAIRELLKTSTSVCSIEAFADVLF